MTQFATKAGAAFNPKTSRITHSIVMVDQATALLWLEKNVSNRSIRQGVVARYRSDMQAGRWTFAADPIRFNVDGDLDDGQHRLTAISEIDDIAVPMLVITGLPVEAQGVMDQGAKRTAGDQLTLAGVKDATFIAATVKQFILWEEKLMFRDNKAAQITAPQIAAWVQDHASEVEFLGSMGTLVKQNDAVPSVAGAAALAFARIDAEAAREFFTLLARGAGTEGQPIVTLDKRLQRIRRDGLKVSHRAYLALLFQAWNYWRADRRVSQFARPRGGSWTEENFPVPA